MESKKNTARMVRVGQMKKSPILALGTSPKDIRNYEKVAGIYGNVVPVIVGESEAGYCILEGQARFMACAQKGCREVPAIVAKVEGEAEQMKLSLLLSTIQEQGGAISEGEFIHQLTTRFGVTNRELTNLLGKSKAWISKRQSLASHLSDPVKEMVTAGCLCARTAEEVAKMPADKQSSFAANIVRDGLNKTEVTLLVQLHRSPETSEACRKAIVAEPLAVLPTLPEPANGSRNGKKDKRSDGERLAGAIRYAIRLLEELKMLLVKADVASLSLALLHMESLQAVLMELMLLLNGIVAGFSADGPARGVSPGKLPGEGLPQPFIGKAGVPND